MGATHVLTPTIVSEETFAPFGEIIAERGDPLPHVYGDTMSVHLAALHDCDTEQTEFVVTRYRLRGQRALYVERHAEITQAFIPLGGSPFLFVMAPPDAPLENGCPALSSLRAFVCPGDMAVQVHRGTWHEVPIPLVDNSLLIVTSHTDLTVGWGELGDDGEISDLPGVEEKLDLTARTGHEVVVAELDAGLRQEVGL
jgi:ureidoglycolate lyase